MTLIRTTDLFLHPHSQEIAISSLARAEQICPTTTSMADGQYSSSPSEQVMPPILTQWPKQTKYGYTK